MILKRSAIGFLCATAIGWAIAAGCAPAEPEGQDAEIAQAHREGGRPVAVAMPQPVPEVPTTAQTQPAEKVWPALVAGHDFNAPASRERQASALRSDFAVPADRPWSAAEWLDAVLARNPEIAAARFAMQSRQAMNGQLEATDRLMAQYSAYMRAMEQADMKPASGDPAFPLPGPSGLRSRLVDIDVAMARAEWEATIRRVIRQTREALADAGYLNARLGIVAERRKLLGSLRESLEARIRAGSAKLSELLLLDSDIARTVVEQADVERESLALTAVLARLVAVKSLASLASQAENSLPADLSADEFAAWQARLPSQPELRAAQLRIERVGVLAELTETLYRPAPRGTDGPERPGEPRPLPDQAPWYGLMEAYRAQLLHDAAANRAAYDALFNSQSSTVRTDWQMWVTAWAAYRLQSETLMKLADQEYEAATAEFSTTNANIQLLLTPIQARLDAQLGAAAAKRDLLRLAATFDEKLGPR